MGEELCLERSAGFSVSICRMILFTNQVYVGIYFYVTNDQVVVFSVYIHCIVCYLSKPFCPTRNEQIYSITGTLFNIGSGHSNNSTVT